MARARKRGGGRGALGAGLLTPPHPCLVCSPLPPSTPPPHTHTPFPRLGLCIVFPRFRAIAFLKPAPPRRRTATFLPANSREIGPPLCQSRRGPAGRPGKEGEHESCPDRANRQQQFFSRPPRGNGAGWQNPPRRQRRPRRHRSLG